MSVGRAGSGRDTKEICAARRNFDSGPEAGKTWFGTGREAIDFSITKRSEPATETNATWVGLRNTPGPVCMYIQLSMNVRPFSRLQAVFNGLGENLRLGRPADAIILRFRQQNPPPCKHHPSFGQPLASVQSQLVMDSLPQEIIDEIIDNLLASSLCSSLVAN